MESHLTALTRLFRAYSVNATGRSIREAEERTRKIGTAVREPTACPK
jgi:hypothetical protein